MQFASVCDPVVLTSTRTFSVRPVGMTASEMSNLPTSG
jgi:hypothetical protein